MLNMSTKVVEKQVRQSTLPELGGKLAPHPALGKALTDERREPACPRVQVQLIDTETQPVEARFYGLSCYRWHCGVHVPVDTQSPAFKCRR